MRFPTMPTSQINLTSPHPNPNPKKTNKNSHKKIKYTLVLFLTKNINVYKQEFSQQNSTPVRHAIYNVSLLLKSFISTPELCPFVTI